MRAATVDSAGCVVDIAEGVGVHGEREDLPRLLLDKVSPGLRCSDLRRCSDFGADSGCIGGVGDGEGPCKPGLRGPYCRLCNLTDNTRYYDTDRSECRPCAGDAAFSFLVALGCGVLLLLLGKLWRCYGRRELPHIAALFERGRRLAVQLSMRAKCKQLLAFYQVATRVSEVLLHCPKI